MRSEYLPSILRDETVAPETNVFRVKVTPELAAKLLARNPGHNRNIDAKRVNAYAKQIVDGSWALTHQGIAIDRDENLLDGQTRLSAVLQTGETVEMVVFTNQDPGNFSNVDLGRGRKAQQFLDGPGKPQVTGALQIIGMIDGSTDASVVENGYRAKDQSMTRTLELLADWPEVTDLVVTVNQIHRITDIGPSAHLAVLAMASRTPYAHLIPGWLESIKSGAGLASDDPRLLLRNRFIREGKKSINRGRGGVAYALIVKAWNAYAKGETMVVLRHGDTEVMPTVVGFVPTGYLRYPNGYSR